MCVWTICLMLKLLIWIFLKYLKTKGSQSLHRRRDDMNIKKSLWQSQLPPQEECSFPVSVLYMPLFIYKCTSPDTPYFHSLLSSDSRQILLSTTPSPENIFPTLWWRPYSPGFSSIILLFHHLCSPPLHFSSGKWPPKETTNEVRRSSEVANTGIWPFEHGGRWSGSVLITYSSVDGHTHTHTN